MRTVEEDLRHNLIIVPLSCLKRLQPPTRAQAPLAPALEAGDAQVVALSGGVVEELLGDLGGDGVVPEVAGRDFAVSAARETRWG